MAKYKLIDPESNFPIGMTVDYTNKYGGCYMNMKYACAIFSKRLVEDNPKKWQLIKDKDSESTDEFKDIYQSLLNMQRIKDAKYGNSALKPLEIFAKHHNYGSRLDEKLARIKHSDELHKNDVADLIGGLVLICKDKGWTNFDDLID